MGGALADPPATPPSGPSNGAPASDAQAPAPQENFVSSLKQAFQQNFDREVVRGHFDVGAAPDARRYYCLVDAKTGKREPNGVSGQPAPRPDGMTGITASAVSLYSCDSAEQQGMLVTSGYVLSGGALARNPPPPVPIAPPGPDAPTAPIAPSVPIAPTAPPQGQPAAALPAVTSPGEMDVAGVRLGMSVDEVRAVLKSKQLLEYYESAETLGAGDSAAGASRSAAGGRFVNVLAAWTSPAPGGDFTANDGESFEVMFTPVPGRERAMAIVHSVAYAPGKVISERTLADGLVKKYGGATTSVDLPTAPTWRRQSDGTVLLGDPCHRRGIVGGLGQWNAGSAHRQNLALRTTPQEFRFQIDQCGVAIVTEDHAAANGGAARGDRVITRFTVTAYSPSIAFEGATAAAQIMQAPPAAKAVGGVQTKNRIVPSL